MMPTPSTEFDHFVHAQAAVYEQVLRELAAGRKDSHWMWFIFPQLAGLGHSAMAARYAIASLTQAERYLAHDLLGPRLRECVEIVLRLEHRTAEDIFGYVDAMKFRSSLTLFSLGSPPGSVFAQAIDKYFAGKPDEQTLHLLSRHGDQA